MIARANSLVSASPPMSPVQVLPVCFAAMPDGDDVHGALAVVYDINHAIVADADSPKILLALQLSTSGGSRFFSQSLYLRKDSTNDLCLERFEFLPRRAGESDRVVSHRAFPVGASVFSRRRGILSAQEHAGGQ